MPKVPEGEKRLADASQLAKMMIDIAIGDGNGNAEAPQQKKPGRKKSIEKKT